MNRARTLLVSLMMIILFLIAPDTYAEEQQDLLDEWLSLGIQLDGCPDYDKQVFHEQNGVLFYHDMLVYYPPYLEGDEYAVPVGTMRINRDAFCNNQNIQIISTPPSLKYIGEFAFGQCRSLEKAVLNKELLAIAALAFYECDHLKNVNFAELQNLLIVGEEAFENTALAGEVYLPPNLYCIGTAAFVGNVHITKIHFPASVTCYPEDGLLFGWDHMNEAESMVISMSEGCSMEFKNWMLEKYESIFHVIFD